MDNKIQKFHFVSSLFPKVKLLLAVVIIGVNVINTFAVVSLVVAVLII